MCSKVGKTEKSLVINAYVNDLYMFPLIFTVDYIYYQETSMIQRYELYFHTDKSQVFNAYVNDLYIFHLIFTRDYIYYQETSVIQRYELYFHNIIVNF